MNGSPFAWRLDPAMNATVNEAQSCCDIPFLPFLPNRICAVPAPAATRR
jgi:hypothetical protein